MCDSDAEDVDANERRRPNRKSINKDSFDVEKAKAEMTGEKEPQTKSIQSFFAASKTTSKAAKARENVVPEVWHL